MDKEAQAKMEALEEENENLREAVDTLTGVLQEIEGLADELAEDSKVVLKDISYLARSNS